MNRKWWRRLGLALLPVPGAACAGGFNTGLAAKVFAAGLAFTAPRALDAVSVGDLAVWGIGGINALDPALTATLDGGHVKLASPVRTLLDRPAPEAGDATRWGSLAADLEQSAFEASPLLRRAGQQILIQSFFDEAFNHLDPYSRYVPPAPAEAERDRLSIDAGAGLTLVRQGAALAIADIVPGGPAADAGLRVGDRLLRVNDAGLRGLSVARAQALLTGPEGTDIGLRVRGLDGAVRDLDIALAYVPPETVFARREGDLFVIRIDAFVANTAERLSQAIETGMSGPHAQAMVLDLRGNRGGLLRQAVTGVALFAEQGVIASTAGRDPAAAHDWRIDGGGDLTQGMKLIVLVDGRTASAAEVMAAALADLGRAVVVGSTTLGKGLVQTLTRLPDGGELYISWSRILAPKGWPLQALGVMPQLCTSLGPDRTASELQSLEGGDQEMAAALAATRAARPPLPAAQAVELRSPCPAAEGSDGDMGAAHFLTSHPEAYAAALLK